MFIDLKINLFVSKLSNFKIKTNKEDVLINLSLHIQIN